MSPPKHQSFSRQGFLAAMAAMSAAVGAFARLARDASVAPAPASTGAVPPSPGAPTPSPETDLVARTPHTIGENAMLNQMMSASTRLVAPEGPGSVSGAPNLPAGFTDTFTSRYIDTGDLRLHAVIGGEGPPLLLVHGWPETWYAWRLLMPTLARKFEVIAVDQRGMGLSDKPTGGYDDGTQAGDLVALMGALGHQRFAVVGHDTGFAISYALAADHPDRVARVALAEIPGAPGTAPSPPLFLPGPLNDRLWHLGFNRIDQLNEQLVAGREDVFFRWEFDAAVKRLPDDVIDYYVQLLSNPHSLRGSFGWYRALETSIMQNEQRKTRRLTMPILAIGGAASFGDHVGNAVQAVADDVQSLVIPGVGHFVAEEAPEEMLAALTAFLGPYRADSARRSDPVSLTS